VGVESAGDQEHPESVVLAVAHQKSEEPVCRVMNGSVPVSDAKRARVDAAIERLGYRPKAGASAPTAAAVRALGRSCAQSSG